jgi:hypothetical protein
MNMEKLTTIKIINLAAKHAHKAEMRSSAELCLEDAVRAFADDPKMAERHALKSLKYSVGAFHPDYRKVLNHVEFVRARAERTG